MPIVWKENVLIFLQICFTVKIVENTFCQMCKRIWKPQNNLKTHVTGCYPNQEPVSKIIHPSDNTYKYPIFCIGVLKISHFIFAAMQSGWKIPPYWTKIRMSVRAYLVSECKTGFAIYVYELNCTMSLTTGLKRGPFLVLLCIATSSSLALSNGTSPDGMRKLPVTWVWQLAKKQIEDTS